MIPIGLIRAVMSCRPEAERKTPGVRGGPGSSWMLRPASGISLS